ncbi:hypothetical protein SAZ11_44495 [Streptomyces sp. FXJ1.4098]|nr:hypothetical protein [Streptomyces sp. FXJ1.4098]
MAALAAATAALSVGEGFLPLSGAADGLPPVATGPPSRPWQRARPSFSRGPGARWTRGG